jgi:hypothetical protein
MRILFYTSSGVKIRFLKLLFSACKFFLTSSKDTKYCLMNKNIGLMNTNKKRSEKKAKKKNRRSGAQMIMKGGELVKRKTNLPKLDQQALSSSCCQSLKFLHILPE